MCHLLSNVDRLQYLTFDFSVAEGIEYKEVALNDQDDLSQHLRETSQIIEKYRAKKIPILVVRYLNYAMHKFKIYCLSCVSTIACYL